MTKSLRRRTRPIPENQVGVHAQRQLEAAGQYLGRHRIRDDEEAFRRIQEAPDIDEIRIGVLKALGF